MGGTTPECPQVMVSWREAVCVDSCKCARGLSRGHVSRASYLALIHERGFWSCQLPFSNPGDGVRPGMNPRANSRGRLMALCSGLCLRLGP